MRIWITIPNFFLQSLNFLYFYSQLDLYYYHFHYYIRLDFKLRPLTRTFRKNCKLNIAIGFIQGHTTYIHTSSVL